METEEKQISIQDNKESKASKDVKENKDKNSKKKKGAGRYAAEFFIKIGITAAIIWALCTFVTGIYVIHSNSGYPMIKDGDLCIIYRLAELHDGDLVAYSASGETHFGRIVAAEGDSIDVEEESLTVNGYGVYEDAVYPTTAEGISVQLPYTVPSESYFLLNDYRSDINDSRNYGGIPKSDIKGKVVFVMRRRGI